jgi:hypothetical protein
VLPIAAAGTTLKMARFLWLLWPSTARASENARGVYGPWSFTVVAVLAGVWILPGSLEWLSVKLSPAKIWLATWPLLAGSLIAAVAAVARRPILPDRFRAIPAGDLLVVIEAISQRLASLVATLSDVLGHGRNAVERVRGVLTRAVARLGERASVAERDLLDWPIAGASLAGVIAAVCLTLGG